ncbi:MAG: LysM peptidoglycan-binding domain-containing protein, partial [Muribaculaceae bacterium]|nr:LysM peptidoglycan-binding domain-containing protein [Muribaculaceae bacterium]
DKKGKTSTVTVKKGDSYYRIAANNGMTVDELCKLNHCKPTDHLSVGSTLKVRKK